MVLTVVLMGLYGCGGTSAPTTEPVTTKTQEAKTQVTAVAETFNAGDTVAAEWQSDNWYYATIKTVTGDNYAVDYADGTSGTVTKDKLKVLDKNLKLAVGDKVMAVWSGARFYSGVVQDLKEGGATVKWDDGSDPSFVELGKIYK